MPEKEEESEVVVQEDTRTEMEKRVEKVKEEREKKMIADLARKSYRERIEAFNRDLDQLTEHFDVPKVGPG